ncbi:hypothetical protein SAMN05192559_1063 [Halobacillus karajensis]|nr:hypothetical protein SAMN05192559_1063 [Halobacillus karajensis]
MVHMYLRRFLETRNTPSNASEPYSFLYTFLLWGIYMGEEKTTLVDEPSSFSENEKLLKDIEEFRDNRVWVTKKTRMEAEARMNTNHLFSLVIVNYYTMFVLSFSIWSLVNKESPSNINLLTVIASVLLFGASIFVSTYGFKEKAISFKNCYLDLYKIENRLDKLLFMKVDHEKLLSEFDEVKKEYNHVLEKTDNHSNTDRLVFLKKKKMIKEFGDFLAYYEYKILNAFIKVFLVLIPIILLTLFIFMGG